MTTIDPEETPLDPDTGLPQQPDLPEPGDSEERPTVELDGDVLAEPDIALDEPPRAAEDAGPGDSAVDDLP
jgi:hypothetical protein